VANEYVVDDTSVAKFCVRKSVAKWALITYNVELFVRNVDVTIIYDVV
jgi:hypothetical protein